MIPLALSRWSKRPGLTGSFISTVPRISPAAQPLKKKRRSFRKRPPRRGSRKKRRKRNPRTRRKKRKRKRKSPRGKSRKKSQSLRKAISWKGVRSEPLPEMFRVDVGFCGIVWWRRRICAIGGGLCHYPREDFHLGGPSA